MNFEQLNIWGQILLGLYILALWSLPLYWGKDRGKVDLKFLIIGVGQFILTLLALNVFNH